MVFRGELVGLQAPQELQERVGRQERQGLQELVETLRGRLQELQGHQVAQAWQGLQGCQERVGRQERVGLQEGQEQIGRAHV